MKDDVLYNASKGEHDEKLSLKYAYREGIVSIIINLILFVLKYWAGIMSGSVALIADAWHTLSDSISSLIVMGSAKVSAKKPTKKHPFGFGRWEEISSIFIGFLLAIVAYEFLRESIQKLGEKESAQFGTFAFVVTILSILFKEGIAQYSLWAYRKTHFTPLKADAWHHRSDAISSVVILAGLFVRDYFWWIDSVLGIVVALMLFYAVFDIVKESIVSLLGQKPSCELIDQVVLIIKSQHSSDLQAHHFHLHNYGRHRELTFHIGLDENVTVKEAHDLCEQIEKEIKEKLFVHATIHIDPVSKVGNSALVEC